MDLFSLVARLTMDTSGFDQGVQRSRGVFSSLSNKLSAGSVMLGNLASKAVEKGIDAVINLGKSVINTGADFEAGMARVAAISGASGMEIEALNEKAKEMGAATVFSATEAASAFEYMAMAGWKTDDMLDGISGVMNLAAASGENLATVSDIVTDVITAMGYSASDSARFADVLAAACTNANTDVALMGDTFKYVAPVAGAMGYSIEDLAIATGLMANSSVKGGHAGTALRAILTNLSKPTKQMSKAMKKLGISVTESDGSMKSLRTVMQNMRQAFAGLTESQRTQYAATIAGQEGMSGLLAIVNASEEDFNNLMEAVDNSSGTASHMAEVMNDTLRGALENLGGVIETISIDLNEMMNDSSELQGLKNIVNFIADSINSIYEAFKLGGLAAALDKAKSILSGLAQSLIDGAPDAFGAAAEAIVNALVGAINAAFGGGIVIPFDVSEIVSSGVGNIIGFIGDTLQWIGDNGDFVKAALEVIAAGIIAVNFAANPVGAALKIIQIALLAIVANWDAFKESVVGGAIVDAVNGIAGAIGSVSSRWDDFALSVARAYDAGGFTGMFSEIWTAVSGIATDIGEAYNNFALFIATKADEAWVATINAIKDSFYNIGKYLSETWENFKEFIDSVVPQGLLDAFEKIKTVWNEISGAISSAITNIKEFFGLNKDEKGFGGGRSSGNGAGRHIPVSNHAVGLDYVPRDNYMANLHRGEAVLTRGEAEEWRRGESGGRGGVTVVQNIYAQEQTAAELMQEAYWQQERAVLMGV